MIQRRIVLASAVGLVSAFLLAACGGSTNEAASGMNPGSVTPAASESAPAAPAAVGADSGSAVSGGGGGQPGTTTGLTAVAVKGLGSVVTDDKGMTLYRYDKDEAAPSKWTCSGECTKTWMPVIVQDSVQTTGVERSLLGTVHRKGQKQLTLNGWPLYRYEGDTAAGQMNGAAMNKMWHAVTPSGGKFATAG